MFPEWNPNYLDSKMIGVENMQKWFELKMFPKWLKSMFLDSKIIGTVDGSMSMINEVITMTPRQNELVVKNACCASNKAKQKSNQF